MNQSFTGLSDLLGTYYTGIAYSSDVNYDFIIGHVPHLTTGCLNLRDIYTRRRHNSKIVLIVHELPHNGNGEIEAEQFRALCEADMVLCMEKSIIQELSQRIVTLEQENTPDYKWYFPGFLTKLFRGRTREKKWIVKRGLHNDEGEK